MVARLMAEFLNRPTVLSSSRYSEIAQDWAEINKLEQKRAISDAHARARYAALMDEANSAAIEFDTFSDFKAASIILAQFLGIPNEHILYEVNHEEEHASVYHQRGIRVKYGWHKFSDGAFQPYTIPHGPEYDSLSNDEKNIIIYRSLLAARDPSDADKRSISRFEQMYPALAASISNR